MCGAQQLHCKSESAPQIIRAHQAHQACNEYTHLHFLKAQSQQGGRGGTAVGTAGPQSEPPPSLGTGALFLISEFGRGEGAQLLPSRPDYMGFAMQATIEWKRGHTWDILATIQSNSLAAGDNSPPPCFRVLFGRVQQCSILRDQTTGDLKSHHLQGHSSVCAPPPPQHTHIYFQQYMTEKSVFLRTLMASSGGHVPLSPPPPWVRHCLLLHKCRCCTLLIVMY